MESMNLALLTKWWWRFFNEPNLLWCKLIRPLYYVRRRPLHKGRVFVPYSQWSKSVLRCRELFTCGVIYELGDGRNIRLCSNIWIGETPFRTLFPNIFENITNTEARISECWNLTNGDGASSAMVLRRLNSLKDAGSYRCLKICFSITAHAADRTRSNGGGPSIKYLQSNPYISSSLM
ncbi:uncharacterized protein LOC109723390 [Ananas comosus]|uniref:Uncharacterized protein LOC109723390 n=1 Tax=Ananas comosus TaxID=4615 RepID=A0A6P5GHN9_ANACO|nr:uncharacterized protein LOC109723390 [Ananas comosus]